MNDILYFLSDLTPWSMANDIIMSDGDGSEKLSWFEICKWHFYIQFIIQMFMFKGDLNESSKGYNWRSSIKYNFWTLLIVFLWCIIYPTLHFIVLTNFGWTGAIIGILYLAAQIYFRANSEFEHSVFPIKLALLNYHFEVVDYKETINKFNECYYRDLKEYRENY